MRVSVVVPTFLRHELLERCLEALASQEVGQHSYEIIVADDAACEETAARVRAWQERASVPIRYLTPARAHGPAAARNSGWRAAAGEIVGFTDDDCIPDARWLAEGVSAFEADTAAVCGRVVVPLPAAPTDHERETAGLERAEFVTANCFVRKSVLEAVGGFDERYACAWREDSDLHFTLLERGMPIVRASRAVVVHPARPAPWGISLKQQRKSLFNALLYRKFPQLYRRRIRAWPPWDYYALVFALAAGAVALSLGRREPAVLALGCWLALTARFCLRRLRGNSLALWHVLEMAVTSAFIPPLSVFWRIYGAWKFRVFFL